MAGVRGIQGLPHPAAEWSTVSKSVVVPTASGSGGLTIVPSLGTGTVPGFDIPTTDSPEWFVLTGVAGQKFRVVAGVGTNTIAPGIAFTFALNALTFAGGNAVGRIILTTVGRSAIISSPPASSATVASSLPFTVAAPGAYCLSVTLGSGNAANSWQALTIALERKRP